MADELAGLREVIADMPPGLIGIDGMNGVGKTRRVAKLLDLPILSTDDYLLGNRNYLGGLDYDRLAIEAAALPRPAVIEGCCLLAIIDRIGARIDLHVYVRGLSVSGFWHDSDVAEGDMLDHVIARNRAIARAAKAGRSNLDHDLAVYHNQYRPYQSAGLVLDLIQRPAE